MARKKKTNDLRNIIIKKVKDGRTPLQRAKDEEIAKRGGIIVGKNAPPELRYRKLKMETEVWEVNE